MPHPISRRAASELRAELRAGLVTLPADLGKMFGVLVVRQDSGHIGYLRAFSGLVEDQSELPGFVPGTSDRAAKDRVWEPRVHILKRMSSEIEALAGGEEAAARAELTAFAAGREQTLAGLRAARAQRREARSNLVRDEGEGSRQRPSEHQEERRLRHTLAEEAARLRARLEVLVGQRRRLEAERRDRCNEALHAFQDTYVLENALGVKKRVRELFAPREVPGGAGDCVGPKLILHAYRHGLRPIAMAEFWWGAAPKAGDRSAGAYYPACTGKCGVVLPFMLQGLAVQSETRFFAPREEGALASSS